MHYQKNGIFFFQFQKQNKKNIFKSAWLRFYVVLENSNFLNPAIFFNVLIFIYIMGSYTYIIIVIQTFPTIKSNYNTIK